VRSHLWMSSVAGQLGPRFRVLGSEQAYVSYGLDPQEAALGNGDTPDTAGFGDVAQDAWGCIGTEDDKQWLASRSGRYGGFYPAVATALQTGAELPVAATDALRGLKIIETAQQSAAEGRVIDLAP